MLKILRPLKDVALLLQSGTAGWETAFGVMEYLRHIARTEPALNSSVKDTLNSWIERNDLVKALEKPPSDSPSCEKLQ